MPGELGSLSAGQELQRDWTVSDRHLYNPSGQQGHAVLSSPAMIMEMETTCAELAKSQLADDRTTVGFHVDVKHVSPARPSATITTVARLTGIDGRKLTFAVEAREGDRLIGVGRHRRVVVSLSDLG